MKSYKLDVPVKINIWIREDCLKKQMNVISQVRPKTLFIQSDGGRTDYEKKIIKKNREYMDQVIDWDCEVYKIYEDKNNGLYEMGEKTRNLIWSKVDRCIFLEDDLLPTKSFFLFCAELLEKYKNDERIECICGFNNLGVWEKCNADYFFSRQGSIWGTATWKRAYETSCDFSYINDEYTINLLKKATNQDKNAWKRIKGYANQEMYEGHKPGMEFFYEFSMYGQNRLQIVPKYNLICNIGADRSAAHSDSLQMLPKQIRKLFYSKTYELTFPLKHPKYVIADIFYESKRNKMMGNNYPFIKAKLDLERAFIKIKSGEWSYLFHKIKERHNRKTGKTVDK